MGSGNIITGYQYAVHLYAVMTMISVAYQAHVQNIGWQNWVNDSEVAGTTGKALRIEAIRILLVTATTI